MEYKNISIEGPTGTIRTSALGVKNHGAPEGVMYVGCIKDGRGDRVLDSQYRDGEMTPAVRSQKCPVLFRRTAVLRCDRGSNRSSCGNRRHAFI